MKPVCYAYRLLQTPERVSVFARGKLASSTTALRCIFSLADRESELAVLAEAD